MEVTIEQLKWENKLLKKRIYLIKNPNNNYFWSDEKDVKELINDMEVFVLDTQQYVVFLSRNNEMSKKQGFWSQLFPMVILSIIKPWLPFSVRTIFQRNILRQSSLSTSLN